MTLAGAIDLHIHAGPDVSPRRLSYLDAAQQAHEAGMAAVYLKSHVTITADIAALVASLVPGVGVYGGITLDDPVGGFNPHAVAVAIELGARMVFMPTHDSANDRRAASAPARPGGAWPAGLAAGQVVGDNPPQDGLTILAADGGLRPEVREILGQIAAADIALATGHLSPNETEVLVDAAVGAGVKRIVVTHALFRTIRMPLDVQRRLAERGAYIEHCYGVLYPAPGRPRVELRAMVEAIATVGPERCILSTDCGQPRNPPPVEALAAFLDLLRPSFPAAALRRMVADNPAFILGHGR